MEVGPSHYTHRENGLVDTKSDAGEPEAFAKQS